MNIKKAVISAVIVYAIVFLVASAILSIKDQPIFGVITLLVSTTLTAVVSREYYFKGVKVKNPVAEGLMFGIVLVLVTAAIEIPVMVYGFAAQEGWAYFTSWHILLGYGLMLFVPMLVAWCKK